MRKQVWLSLHRGGLRGLDSSRSTVCLPPPLADADLCEDAGDEIAVVDRLDDELTDIQGHSCRPGGHIILGSEEDDRQRGRETLKLHTHLTPIHLRHHHMQSAHVYRPA